MVMSSNDQVYARDVSRHIFVQSSSHVGDGNDQISPLASQGLNLLCCYRLYISFNRNAFSRASQPVQVRSYQPEEPDLYARDIQ